MEDPLPPTDGIPAAEPEPPRSKSRRGPRVDDAAKDEEPPVAAGLVDKEAPAVVDPESKPSQPEELKPEESKPEESDSVAASPTSHQADRMRFRRPRRF